MTPDAEIRRLISARGRMTFAEFMDAALYHPANGYYTSGERIGASGDFYTSPSVSPAFGALLALQLFQMWRLLGEPGRFTVVEPGSGNGLLCRDILVAAAALPGAFRRSLRYVCLDRRDTRGYEQGLREVSRIASSVLPLRGIVGCILSNELLDAMPVHQVTMEQGRLCEIYVALDRDTLATTTGELSNAALAQRLEDRGIQLAEGQTAEINLSAESWVAETAGTLERGFVLTIDYGRTAGELYSPTERFHGTLTTFHRHLQTDRPLERIGQQDMSAQVDFSTLAGAGKQAGLDFFGYTTQAAFLRNLGLETLLSRAPSAPMRQAQASRVGMREIAKPGGLGDFKVMAQGKNVGSPELWGLQSSDEAAELAKQLPPVAPTAQHLDLLAGRYPAAEVEFEMTWDAL